MQSNGVVKTGGFSPETLRKYLPTMSKDTIQKFQDDGGVLYHATIGPGDALLLPFDYIFTEKVTKDSDVIGLRLCFWYKSDEKAYGETNRWLIAQKSPSQYLQQAVELCLNLEEDPDGPV